MSDLTAGQLEVLRVMHRNGGLIDAIATTEISSMANRFRYWSRDKLVSLEGKGMVKRAGMYGREQCWWLTDQGVEALAEQEPRP